MPKELIEKTIDGTAYQIGQATTSKQLKILTRLNKLIMEPLGVLAGDSKNLQQGKEMKLDIEACCKALAGNLEEETVLATVKELMEVVIANGKAVEFDLHFQGRLKHLFKVVYAVLEAQYGDFFEGLGDVRKRVLAAIDQSLKQK